MEKRRAVAAVRTTRSLNFLLWELETFGFDKAEITLLGSDGCWQRVAEVAVGRYKDLLALS